MTNGRRLAITALTGLSLIWSQVALSTNVDYQFAGLRYMDQSLDDYDCNQNGLEIYGSYDINGQWFAVGSLADVSGSSGCGSETLSAGAGWRNKFNDIFDLYGTLAIETTSPDNGGSDSGLVVGAGFRGFIGDDLEGNLGLSHHTTFDGETALNGGLVYWFSDKVSATADLSWGADISSIAVGARFRF